MSTSRETQLKQAAAEAFARFEDRRGEVFDPEPTVRLLPRVDIYAEVKWHGNGAAVDVSVGCLQRIEALWQNALQSKVLIDDAGNRLESVDGEPVTEERLAHLSLTWLILHELMHLRLGHLDVLDIAALAECDIDIAEASEIEVHWSEELDEAELPLIRPCLELQADNDATEVMFGVYDETEWSRFRIEAAAIFVVMAVMEKAEVERDNPDRTYPKVATRFFTLFAQLFQYWLYGDAQLEAGDGESFVRTAREPSGEDFQRYMKFVLALAISDAIHIALWGDAKSFLDDLGAGSALFSDLFEAQYADKLATADLQTAAANEWRKLLPVNEKIMNLSGLRDG